MDLLFAPNLATDEVQELRPSDCSEQEMLDVFRRALSALSHYEEAEPIEPPWHSLENVD